jgi:NitT/TauT family transport system ATP-binding protein
MQELLLKIYDELKTTIVLVTHDIQEAVFLADEIYIMSNAPSHFVHKIDIKSLLPRDENFNRNKRDSNFIKMIQSIEDLMMNL